MVDPPGEAIWAGCSRHPTMLSACLPKHNRPHVLKLENNRSLTSQLCFLQNSNINNSVEPFIPEKLQSLEELEITWVTICQRMGLVELVFVCFFLSVVPPLIFQQLIMVVCFWWNAADLRLQIMNLRTRRLSHCFRSISTMNLSGSIWNIFDVNTKRWYQPNCSPEP